MVESELNDSTTMNSSNPFFISSSDNPNSILVIFVLNETGFNSWKQSMMISLSAKSKLGFVDGTIPKPLITSSSYSNWDRANSMVVSWILNSLSKNIVESILFL